MERWARRVLNEKETDRNIMREKESAMPQKEAGMLSKEAVNTNPDDHRGSAKLAIEQEIKGIIQEEVRNAAKELVEEQKIAIRVAVEEHKRVIREVLEEEKLSIRAKLEETRESIIRLGMG